MLSDADLIENLPAIHRAVQQAIRHTKASHLHEDAQAHAVFKTWLQRNSGDPESLIYTTAYRRAIDFLREYQRGWRNGSQPEYIDWFDHGHTPNYDMRIEAEELLSQLPPIKQTILYREFFGEETAAETAVAMGHSESSIAQHRRLARKILRGIVLSTSDH